VVVPRAAAPLPPSATPAPQTCPPERTLLVTAAPRPRPGPAGRQWPRAAGFVRPL